MIYIDNIRGMKPQGFDESYAVVQSMKNINTPWLRQLSALAPSRELFYQYLRLKKEGRWNGETFRNIYVPRFLWEMDAPEAKAALQSLAYKDRQGVNIQLCCFCTDPRLCHRTIVAWLLQTLGANVHTPEGVDYSHYNKEAVDHVSGQ